MEKIRDRKRLCPVCHGDVDEQQAMVDKLNVYYLGRFYYLMCRQCKEDFLRGPERYTDSKDRGVALVPRPRDHPKGGNNGAM